MNIDLERNIVASYRGIRKFLGKNCNDDFVIEKATKSYNNLNEALIDFCEYEKELENASKQNLFILKKVTATKYYLMSMLGQEIPYNEYIKNTIGADVKYTEQKVINDIISQIKRRLSLISVPYTREAINSELYNLQMTKDELKNYLLNEYKRQKKIVEDYLGIEFKEEFYIEFIDDEMPYKYYLSFRDGKYALRVNLNLEISRFNTASLRYAIAHEVFGHALQLSNWKNRIHSNKINQICGCEEDYGPEIFQLEGVAESLVYFIFDDEFGIEMELELLLDRLHHLVQNNAYLMYNTGHSLDESTDYYCKYYILNDRNYVENRISLSKDDSFYRANLYVYGDCLDTFIDISNKLTTDNKKIFLNKMYKEPMTKEQILEYANKLTI